MGLWKPIVPLLKVILITFYVNKSFFFFFFFLIIHRPIVEMCRIEVTLFLKKKKKEKKHGGCKKKSLVYLCKNSAVGSESWQLPVCTPSILYCPKTS